MADQLMNPTISASVSRDSPQEGVMLGQTLELGGKRDRRIAVACEEQKSTEIDIAVPAVADSAANAGSVLPGAVVAGAGAGGADSFPVDTDLRVH